MLLIFSLLSICAALASSMEGSSNSEEWAYQWYTDESFRFVCHIANVNISQTDHVIWETPDKRTLQSPHNDTDYQLLTSSNTGVNGLELVVKNVHQSVHGVYICTVKNQKDAVVGRTIYGLNIHEPKYHDMMDKYRHQIYVALVATAVFIVPLFTTCFVWHFQYVTPEMEARRLRRARGDPYHANNEMQQVATNGKLAQSVMSSEGNWVYENPEVFTQL